MLDSGQTAVIGGLTTDTDTEIDSRVPYRGDFVVTTNRDVRIAP